MKRKKTENVMDRNSLIKNTAILITPLLLFVVLLVPYCLINQHYIVEWFGCGCPTVDEMGNYVESVFNANDFTSLFWTFISICATVISFFISKRIPKKMLWLRIAYVIAIFVVSLLISKNFCQLMMWK